MNDSDLVERHYSCHNDTLLNIEIIEDDTIQNKSTFKN